MNNFFKSALLGLVVILILISGHYLGWLRPAEGWLVKAASPVQVRAYSLALNLKNWHGRWLTKRDLLAENEELKRQLERSRFDHATLNTLEEENKLLKAELDFVQERAVTAVAAKIVTGVSDPLSKSVIINRGAADGLEKGLGVVAGSGVIVGKITEVYPSHSKVLLLTDNKSRLAATIQNLDRTTGLVEGQFGLSFTMTNIPQDQEINEGDLIVTSGLEGKIPKGLLVAEVESIKVVESEIFKTALLRPIIPLDNLSQVLVIIP